MSNFLKNKGKIIILCLFTLLYYLFLPSQIYANSLDNSLYAKYAILIDADSTRVLYEKNGFEKVSNASTTKILTCLTTLELANLEDIVEISSYAASMPDVQLNITTSQKFILKDLLYSMMLQSHNDSAVAIAEHIAAKYLININFPYSVKLPDNIEKIASLPAYERNKDESIILVDLFCNYMNYKAAQMGCSNTSFLTPNGLDSRKGDDFHGTTAYDLAIIMSNCIKNDTFLTITQTQKHIISDTNNKFKKELVNANTFLNQYEGVISGKTGFTNKAGYCYVCAFKKNETNLISVVFASGWPNNKTYKWSDTKKLLEYGSKNYTKRNILSDFTPTTIKIDPKSDKCITTCIKDNINILCKDTDNISSICSYQNFSKDTAIEENQVIGKISIYINDELYNSYPIYSQNSYKPTKYVFLDFFNKIFTCFLKLLSL